MPYLLFDGKNSPSIPFTLNRASPQAAGLLLWYPTVGYVGRLADYAAANHFGGTLTGPPGVRREPSVGIGMDFTGSERWEVTHVSDLSTTTRTISAWVIGDTLTGTQTIVKKDVEYILRCDNTSLTLYTWTSGGLNQISATLSTGTLYHVCGTWDGTNAVLYVNGVQKNTSTPGGTTSTSSNNWTIGAQPGGGEGWDGLIADVRLYNRALSAAEIWSLYAPQTRWDLYRVTPFAGAPSIAAPVVSGAIRMPLLGVG